MRYAKIGGQAVLEGVMMRYGDEYAVAVRKPDGEIEIKKEKCMGLVSRFHMNKVPIVRGVLSFIDSLVLGMTTLTYSSSFYEDEDPGQTADDREQPDEKTLKKQEQWESLMMAGTVVLSIAIAVVLFMLTPFFISSLLGKVITSELAIAALEGLFRILIFMGYMIAISQMKDIQRVFMYHGAEHKTIACIEHGMELTPENAASCSRLHKRCGTSFLLIVMIVSIICFMFIRVDGLIMRLIVRILLIPVIAGVSYEIIQWAGRHDNALVDLVSAPGLMLQRLTTREPDASMLEVAIASIEAIYDWRAFQAGEERAACDK